MTLSVHPVRRFRRLRARLTSHPEARLVDAARTHDPVERELIEGRLGDWKDDVFVAGGDGAVAPLLPEATPRGLYEEFERDESPPRDPAP